MINVLYNELIDEINRRILKEVKEQENYHTNLSKFYYL